MTWLWGYLIPVGILLAAWGTWPAEKARRATPLAAFALALALLGYALTGFAFHLGGAGVLKPDLALSGLDRLWSPLDQAQGLGWGMLGLAGFALAGAEVTSEALGLFLSYVPLLAAAVLLLALALNAQRRGVMLASAALLAFWVWPVAACWLWGGGWLAQLGQTLALGHGVVDFGGSSLLFWLPAAFAAGVLWLAPRRPVQVEPGLPPAHAPMAATLGGLLAVLGWLGWALGTPFHTYDASLDWNRTALSLLFSTAGAIVTAQAYGWLVSGEPEPLLTARGALAGVTAALSGAPFFTPWAALVLGLLVGLLVPLVLYLVEERWRLQDEAALLALALSAALVGMVGTGLLADGRAGVGWNGITAGAVRGLLIGGGAAQLGAQVVGLFVLGVWGLMWGTAVGGVLRLAQRTPGARSSLEAGEGAPTPQAGARLEPEPSSSQTPTPAPDADAPTPELPCEGGTPCA